MFKPALGVIESELDVWDSLVFQVLWHKMPKQLMLLQGRQFSTEESCLLG